MDEAVLDEVRLAVGEACSRAVGLHRSSGVDKPVRVLLTEDDKKFSIEVGDEVPATPVNGTAPGGSATSAVPSARSDEPAPEDSEADDEGQMGLAVISGLVDDVEVFEGDNGGLIRMTWPTTAL